MIASSSREVEQICMIEGYTSAWALGTGLRVGLSPGEYRITANGCVEGVRYFQLEDAYRIDSSLCVPR